MLPDHDSLGGRAPDPRQYLRLLWRRKWIVAAIVIVLPVAAYLISSSLTKTYESSTTLKIEANSFSSSLFTNQISVNSSTVEEGARLIQTPAVARVAAKELGEPPTAATALLGSIDAVVDEASSGTSSGFVVITARASEAQRAADVANAFANAVAKSRTDAAINQINRTIDQLNEQADATNEKDSPDAAATKAALAEQLQQLRGLRASQDNSTQVIERALPASSPVSPNPRRNTALALVAAVLLAIGLVALLDALDRKLHETTGIEELVGAPLLAMIPRSAFPGSAPGPQVREAFQTLRAGLTYFNVDQNLNRVLITSATHSEGKTTVAVNLSAAIAQDGKHVILVDGDSRRPQAANRVGAEPTIGLSDVLLGDQPLDKALIDVQIGSGSLGSLQILPSILPQPPNPSVMLGSERMKSLLAELSERADIVIIDTPPILAVSDAIPLIEQVSGTVLIARLDRTSRDALTRARQVISTVRGNVLGVVATGARSGGLYGDGLGYGYGYSYGYVADEDGDIKITKTDGEPFEVKVADAETSSKS